MVLPIIPILTSAVSRFVSSKLSKKGKSVSLGEAVVGAAVTRLVPVNSHDTTTSSHDDYVSFYGREFGDLLARAIPEGKLEEIGERSLGRFLKSAGERLDPQT